MVRSGDSILFLFAILFIMIKFNEVTWYSKLAAVIFFIGVLPVITFCIGVQYENVKRLSEEPVRTYSTMSKGDNSVKTLPNSFFTDGIKQEDPELQDVMVLGRGDINQDGFEDVIVISYSCGAGCVYYLDVVLNNNNQSVNAKVMDFDGINGSPSAFKSLISTIIIKNGIISITGEGFDCQGESEKPINEICKISEDNQWMESKTINYKFDGTKIVRLK